jgi:hypothetical protein
LTRSSALRDNESHLREGIMKDNVFFNLEKEQKEVLAERETIITKLEKYPKFTARVIKDGEDLSCTSGTGKPLEQIALENRLNEIDQRLLVINNIFDLRNKEIEYNKKPG